MCSTTLSVSTRNWRTATMNRMYEDAGVALVPSTMDMNMAWKVITKLLATNSLETSS